MNEFMSFAAWLARAGTVVLLGALTTLVAQAAGEDALLLEEVVATTVPSPVTKMSSSLSINSLSRDQALTTVPRTTMDALLTIPGMRIEASGGESNANVSVRGVPIASGGSKYVQLHEDGLPVLEFGDIVAGNADNYYSLDYSLSRIEVVKGGTATTLTSNSPAGVINFVSKRGEEESGTITFYRGLDYSRTRVDFEYGKPLGENDDWLFHISGFYHSGEGLRQTGFRGDGGGQLRLSLQKNFDNDGHIRLYAKRLDNSTQTYLPMPVRADGTNSISNFDVAHTGNILAELVSARTGDLSGGVRESSIGNGSLVESSVLGGDLRFDLSQVTQAVYRFRIARNSGRFFGALTAGLGSAAGFIADPGSLTNAFVLTQDNPDTGDVDETVHASDLTLRYVSGENSGRDLTVAELQNLNGNGLMQNIRSFDNDINSLNNFSHNLSFVLALSEGHDLTLGIYQATQEIDVEWFWQTYLADVNDRPRLLDVFSGTEQLSTGGTAAYGVPDEAYCCYRDTYLETGIGAPYLAYVGQLGSRFSLNASLRFDFGNAQGHYALAPNRGIDVDRDGTVNVAESHSQVVSQQQISASKFFYNWGYFSWALGGNVLLTANQALFFNFSAGGRVNADRLGDGRYFRNGDAVADSVVNSVATFEVGYKLNSRTFDTIATLFLVSTADTSFERTQNDTDTAVNRDYTSLGLEWEFNISSGIFDMRGSVSWISPEISAAPDNPELVGNTPRRQPALTYALTPQFRFGKSGRATKSSIGLSIIGTSASYSHDANGYELPAYTFINLFVRGYVSENFSLGIDINNVGDTVGLTEAEENAPISVDGVQYVRARSITGRTIGASLRYEF